MNMIRHASNAEAFAIETTNNRCKVSMEIRSNRRLEKRCPFFGTEDDVDQKIRKGFRHRLHL